MCSNIIRTGIKIKIKNKIKIPSARVIDPSNADHGVREEGPESEGGHDPKLLVHRPGACHPAHLIPVLRIRDPVPFWTLDTWSGIGFFRIPDLGSRIPNPYLWELSDIFLGKKFTNSCKCGPNFFVQHFKKKIIYNFVKFMAIKKGMTTNFFSPLPFVAVFGSGIRDPGPGIRDG